MITQDAMDQLDIGIRPLVRDAMTVIMASGIIQHQVELEQAQLRAGSEHESEDKLVERVRQYRRTVASLESLASAFASFTQEN